MEVQDGSRLRITYRVSQLLAWCFIIPVFFFPMIVAGSGKAVVSQLPAGLAATFTLIALLSAFLAKPLSAIPLRAAQKRWIHARNHAVLQSSWLLGLIVGFTLRELCGVLGLVLSLLSGNLFYCTLLGLIAFISMARNWPTGARLAEFAAAVNNREAAQPQ